MTFFDWEAAVGDCSQKGRACRYRTAGFSWTQMEPHIYKRFLLRRCIECHKRDAEIIHWIRPELPVCTNCFSQDWTITPNSDGEQTLTCLRCHKTQSEMFRELST